MPEYFVRAFQHESYSKVADFRRLHYRLTHSLQQLVAKADAAWLGVFTAPVCDANNYLILFANNYLILLRFSFY